MQAPAGPLFSGLRAIACRSGAIAGSGEILQISRVIALFPVAVVQFVQHPGQGLALSGYHLHPHQYPPISGAVVAVVEHGNIPALTQMIEKIHQRAGPLGKFKAVDPFIVDNAGGRPSDHMANVQLRHLIVGEVGHHVAFFTQALNHVFTLFRALGNLHADKDMGLCLIGIAVVEFRNTALAQGGAECLEAARAFGNCDTQYRLALFPDLGALGNITQAVKVGIGPTVDRQQGGATDPCLLHIFFQPRQSQCTGGLGDGAGIFEDILDGRTDFIRAGSDDLIDRLAYEPECFPADLRDGDPIGEEAHLRQGDPAPPSPAPWPGRRRLPVPPR